MRLERGGLADVATRAGRTVRGYSTFKIKSFDDDKRIITGIATTPSTDRMDDIVEPRGAVFKLPIPLLWQHDSDDPVGQVTAAKITDAGIEVTCEFAHDIGPPSLDEDLDRYWSMVKNGLVRGLSIGFIALETSQIEGSWGVRFISWEWLELSAVTIPANQDASIQTIRSVDLRARAALGQIARHSISLEKPGASGGTKRPKAVSLSAQPEGVPEMANVSEQIVALGATKTKKQTRMNEIMQASIDGQRSTEPSEQEEFDGLKAECDALDADLTRLKWLEDNSAKTATPVARVENHDDPAAAAAASRATSVERAAAVQVKRNEKLLPGQGFARMAKCIGLAKGSFTDAMHIAAARYPHDDDLNGVMKAAVAAGTTSGWATGLIPVESGIFADFVEWLRPQTIVGKFGTNGIPDLRRVPFRVPLIAQTSGGQGYWVGEGMSKPLTKFDFTRITLTPLKVANIAVATMETLRDSSPNAEVIIRDQLGAALRERIDRDFIDPNKTAVDGISPASITNGLSAITATGVDADHVRADVKALFSLFIQANNAPTSGVWVMDNTTALALSLMRNALGQPEFPLIGMMGGTFEGLPVIASEFVNNDSNGANVFLVNAQDIYFADDGEVSVDMSREASLIMDDAPPAAASSGQGGGGGGAAGTAQNLVSLWQTNSVGFLAERSLNWRRRRTQAVSFLADVNWGS